MRARVHVTLKPGVLDPQGEAVRHALGSLGFEGVGEVRMGKVIEIEIDQRDPGAARAQVDAMCARLLANTVIEDYEVEIA
ncbi:MAG: phosphoribosylformylglycinamidine synthase subunit PurS [Rhodobacteraceae bacterium]|uniref:phosphoribosylformylglycinamidine synthase subunit PurS n=1 Tax=Amaricoccus sp. TaxID=1872485 RepID=UPI001E0E9CF4|nr:phosphoribosylformylglycinamidine synthase subunit PurS [Amaricoccus sp.]MCB1369918.1 phosphoribosylformylglycinamidine synthase subunit PurS [Paracoccaceae bacterium]MCB1374794.1 phosphoribosylformylglycinamidine synthase subunit PurS [Paracoccaceae bacterium]MCB1401930.1 phosphoribosylformylglycinamidine synthase subunit PurS [Paracoccaceae bacterium]HRW16676.1 phosphoribosylformylglycinamidine synthase subunit PurS [Amaricoccus sp.]